MISQIVCSENASSSFVKIKMKHTEFHMLCDKRGFQETFFLSLSPKYQFSIQGYFHSSILLCFLCAVNFPESLDKFAPKLLFVSYFEKETEKVEGMPLN